MEKCHYLSSLAQPDLFIRLIFYLPLQMTSKKLSKILKRNLGLRNIDICNLMLKEGISDSTNSLLTKISKEDFRDWDYKKIRVPITDFIKDKIKSFEEALAVLETDCEFTEIRNSKFVNTDEVTL